MQPKLLRTLDKAAVRPVGSTDSIPVDVRVIAATNRDLWTLVRRGAFREDLYYRLAVLEHWMPPLRDRRRDIPAIARDLLKRTVAPSSSTPTLTAAAMETLCKHDWPGNLREFENALHTAIVFSSGAPIEPHHLPERVLAPGYPDSSEERGARKRRYVAPSHPHLERKAILSALRTEGGNRTRAARRLGMSRSTLWVKLKQYGIEAVEASRLMANRGRSCGLTRAASRLPSLNA